MRFQVVKTRKLEYKKLDKFAVLLNLYGNSWPEELQGQKVVAVMTHIGVDSLPQTLIFYSLYLWNPIS